MKNKFMIFIVLLVLGICILSIKYYNAKRELKENKMIYCVMDDPINAGKMELYYDFKDGHAYKYTVVSSYKMTNDFNIESAKSLISKSNETYKGIVQSFWTDNNIRITTEVYYLDLMTEEDYNSTLGKMVKGLKEKSRQEIIDSIIPIGENATFKCN